MHRLNRQIKQHFSLTTGLPLTSQALSDRMTFERYLPVDGGRLRVKVGVKMVPGPNWTGSRTDNGRIDHYPLKYADLGASEQTVAKTDRFSYEATSTSTRPTGSLSTTPRSPC